jgi:hypothetical protein
MGAYSKNAAPASLADTFGAPPAPCVDTSGAASASEFGALSFESNRHREERSDAAIQGRKAPDDSWIASLRSQ